MKQISFKSVINILLIIWGLIWFYYAVFNWDIFVIELKTNLGFVTLSAYPFVFFFIAGSIILFIVRYAGEYSDNQRKKMESELKNKLILHEKDIEILKLKEVLFKMQNEEFTKNTSNLNELHEKINGISDQLKKTESKNGDEDSV